MIGNIMIVPASPKTISNEYVKAHTDIKIVAKVHSVTQLSYGLWFLRLPKIHDGHHQSGPRACRDSAFST